MENKYKFTKEHTQVAKGVALLLMLFDHLYWMDYGKYTAFIKLPNVNDIPWLIGSVGNICVTMFLFLSGYGMFFSQQKRSYSIKDSLKRIYNIWIQYAFITIIIIALDSAFGKIQLDIRKIVLNVAALDYSYNKFAWFMITYIVIIFVFPLINKIYSKTNWIVQIGILVGIKCGITVINTVLQSKCVVPEIIYKMFIEPFMFLPVFLIGYVCAEYKVFERALNFIQDKITKKYKIGLVIILIGTCIFMLQISATVFDNITAPLLCFTIPYILMSGKVAKVLQYIGKMSTNMWLIHYPIMVTLLNALVYAPRYWLLILIWLIIIMIPICYLIDWSCKYVKIKR
ncbi:acyltransferase [Eubacterium sp.]|uniref:acyltransferase family protein n=1 Tax=Eubacterium sp. TaxID=142586 RepID=UPI001D56B039|nr:acyltransferase [Eubacterium sp.]MBS5619193.1 acyltransferase [Eubacterium sp.]